MSLFFDRFKFLCEEKGESPNSFARKNGIPSGSITAWKNGSIPRPATLDKIATALGVSVGYLLGTENEKKPTSEGEREITFDDFTYAMYDEAKDLPPEKKQMLLEMARFMKADLEKDKK